MLGVMSQSMSAEIGANIRAEMARRGVSQAEIGSRLGISQTGVSKRLAGTIPIDVNELPVIAETLDVPLSVLLPAKAVA